MDGVHVVDESLHRLVDAGHRAVDSELYDPLFTLQSVEVAREIVVDFALIQMREVLSVELFEAFHLLNKAGTNERSQVEIEGGDGLSAVHLVLSTLQRDASQHRSGLYALGRT